MTTMTSEEPTTALQTGPVGQFPTFLFPPPDRHTLIKEGESLARAEWMTELLFEAEKAHIRFDDPQPRSR